MEEGDGRITSFKLQFSFKSSRWVGHTMLCFHRLICGCVNYFEKLFFILVTFKPKL